LLAPAIQNVCGTANPQLAALLAQQSLRQQHAPQALFASSISQASASCNARSRTPRKIHAQLTRDALGTALASLASRSATKSAQQQQRKSLALATHLASTKSTHANQLAAALLLAAPIQLARSSQQLATACSTASARFKTIARSSAPAAGKVDLACLLAKNRTPRRKPIAQQILDASGTQQQELAATLARNSQEQPTANTLANACKSTKHARQLAPFLTRPPQLAQQTPTAFGMQLAKNAAALAAPSATQVHAHPIQTANGLVNSKHADAPARFCPLLTANKTANARSLLTDLACQLALTATEFANHATTTQPANGSPNLELAELLFAQRQPKPVALLTLAASGTPRS
jgi:hypothetical protein